jgi:hypothetical protein
MSQPNPNPKACTMTSHLAVANVFLLSSRRDLLLLVLLSLSVLASTTSPFHVVILSAAKDPCRRIPVFAVAVASVLVIAAPNSFDTVSP